MAFDLFGEIPITRDDLVAWTRAVAGFGPESPRFDYYVEHWHVAAKVRAAKISGAFNSIVSEAGPRPIDADRAARRKRRPR